MSSEIVPIQSVRLGRTFQILLVGFFLRSRHAPDYGQPSYLLQEATLLSDEIIAEVRDLVVRFGDFTAVDGLTFDVRKGEIFGFLGPNGAGKTTTIRSITTIQRPTSGKVFIAGHDASTDYIAARRYIGIAQQHISLDKDLTVRQNVKHHAMLHKIPKAEMEERIEYAADLLGLQEYMDKKVDSLSGGWKRKASIVCAIVHKPELLLLDEPTAGLDTRSRRLLWDLVRDLNSRGTTIFLTTHYIEEAESLCDRVAIINHGRMVACGTIPELKALVGPVSVDHTADGRLTTRYFQTLPEAKAYADMLDDSFCNVRQTTLEDVFLELTGEDRGRFA